MNTQLHQDLRAKHWSKKRHRGCVAFRSGRKGVFRGTKRNDVVRGRVLNSAAAGHGVASDRSRSCGSRSQASSLQPAKRPTNPRGTSRSPTTSTWSWSVGPRRESPPRSRQPSRGPRSFWRAPALPGRGSLRHLPTVARSRRGSRTIRWPRNCSRFPRSWKAFGTRTRPISRPPGSTRIRNRRACLPTANGARRSPRASSTTTT